MASYWSLLPHYQNEGKWGGPDRMATSWHITKWPQAHSSPMSSCCRMHVLMVSLGKALPVWIFWPSWACRVSGVLRGAAGDGASVQTPCSPGQKGRLGSLKTCLLAQDLCILERMCPHKRKRMPFRFLSVGVGGVYQKGTGKIVLVEIGLPRPGVE